MRSTTVALDIFDRILVTTNIFVLDIFHLSIRDGFWSFFLYGGMFVLSITQPLQELRRLGP